MSAPKWLRDYWWLPVGTALVAFGAWTADLRASVVELQGKVDAVEEVRTIAYGLARMACLKEYRDAQTAGLPCRQLFNGLRSYP